MQLILRGASDGSDELSVESKGRLAPPGVVLREWKPEVELAGKRLGAV